MRTAPNLAGARAGARRDEAGMMLLEVLVALGIVAMVTISYLGIRTEALADAKRARDWRLAREIAEEKLSELQAGAREVPPESGVRVPIEKYEGFAFKIVLGASGVADIESEVATNAAGDDSATNDRLEWQRNRDDYRRASARGLTAQEYEDESYDDINDRLAEKAPSPDEFEEVAVVVYFPKTDPDYPEEEEALLIKSRVSTLAISGMTPQQASDIAEARGETGGAAAGAAAGSDPLGGGR